MQVKSRGGSTPKTYDTINLIRHLKEHHPGESDKYEAADAAAAAKEKAQTVEPSRPQANQEPRLPSLFDNMEKTKEITKKIMEFIALDDQPFSIIEDTGFINLMKHASPQIAKLVILFRSRTARVFHGSFKPHTRPARCQ